MVGVMSTSGVSRPPDRIIRWRVASIVCLLTAAGLFMYSAVLQNTASLQRWVVFSSSRGPRDLSVEDHIYDYYFPWTDWVPIGTAAELFGAGIMVQVVGIVVMAAGTLPQGRPARGTAEAWLRVLSLAAEVLLVLAVAAAFALLGMHALLSGMAGAASELRPWVATGLLAGGGLAVLAMLWRRKLPGAAAACLFLIGSSLPGYVLATYMIAPVLGGGSHDTARWTESVVAASTAGAGVALIVAIWNVARPARSVAPAAKTAP